MPDIIVVRAYPHPHNPSVCVVDRLGPDGLAVGTRNFDWDRAPWWAERAREVSVRMLDKS